MEGLSELSNHYKFRMNSTSRIFGEANFGLVEYEDEQGKKPPESRGG